jgi:hypothetical protein
MNKVSFIVSQIWLAVGFIIAALAADVRFSLDDIRFVLTLLAWCFWFLYFICSIIGDEK